jgi:drug/metabolite transporter (DMT)-like permease
VVYLYLIIQQLIASSAHLISQDASTAIAPSVVVLFRSLGASVIFLPILIIMEKRWNIFAHIEQKDYGLMLLLSLLNVPINQWLFLTGLKYTTPANNALFYAMTPAFVFLFTLLWHKERPSGLKVLGILMALAGASTIVFEHGAAIRPEQTAGNILAFLGMIAWSLYTMMGRPMVLKYGSVYTTGITMIIGTLLYLPFGLITSSMAEVSAISPRLWVEIGYLAVFTTVINYLLWFYAVGKLTATKVAIFQNLQPVATTILALILGKVVMTTELWGGGLFALAGVFVMQLG